MAPDTDGGTIPGLTPQGERVLRMVVREEVTAGIKDALANPACPRPCERVADLETATYGNGDGRGGIKGRVTTLEEQVGSLVWWNRATIAASLSAVGALIVNLVKG